MNVWVVLAQGLLAAGALAAVAYPLVRGEDADALLPPGADALRAERETLLAEKRVAYEAIRELELDWKSGKLSEADYQTIRREMEAEAIRVLQKLDAIEDHEAPSPEVKQPSCPSCSREIESAHDFCPDCGTRIS